MKLRQKTGNNANNAYLFWILSVVCVYLTFVSERIGFLAVAMACLVVGILFFRKSRRQFVKLKKKL